MRKEWEHVAEMLTLARDEREAFAADMSDIDQSEAALAQYMADLCQLPNDDQHAALSNWARSDHWHPALMICTGWQGSVARAAWDALKADLAAATPGRRWDQIDPQIGRASICRLLKLEGEAAAAYAAAPFRTWTDDDGRSWIAGAIGCRPFLDAAAATRWCHLDIRDVLLWEPRTGEVIVAGEHRSISTFVMPDHVSDRLMVWGEGSAFFRAWAHARARTGQLAMRRAAGDWAHPVTEPRDGGLPGGLLIGNIRRATWPMPDVRSVTAGQGVTVGELHYAAACAARLPLFVEAR